MPRRKCRLS